MHTGSIAHPTRTYGVVNHGMGVDRMRPTRTSVVRPPPISASGSNIQDPATNAESASPNRAPLNPPEPSAYAALERSRSMALRVAPNKPAMHAPAAGGDCHRTRRRNAAPVNADGWNRI